MKSNKKAFVTMLIQRMSMAIILFLSSLTAFTQGVGINETGAAPDPSAALDVSSTTKGMLIPRVTLSERNAIVLPATGLMVYQTDDVAGFYFNAGTPVSVNWQLVGFNAVAPSQWISSGDNIYYNEGYVGIGTNSPTAGLHVNDGNVRITNGKLDFGDQHRIITYTANNNMSVQSPGPVSVVLDNNNNQNNEAFTVRKDNIDPDLATELFRVQENGRIGIGTSSPEYRLHVKNGDAMIEDSSWCNFKIKSFNFNTDPALQLYARDSVWAIVNDDSENNDLDFRYNNYTWMSVEKDGRVSIGSNQSDPSSILQLYSTNKGFLPPRMNSTQIAAIQNPANGLTVFNTSDRHLYVFNTTDYLWKRVAYDTPTITPVFNCGGLLYDSRDGQYYETVQIGTQCWMAENLNYAGATFCYCFNNDPAYCEIYGRLYQSDWYDPCPPGWHQPIDDEWCTLGTYLDPSFDCVAYPTPQNIAGGKLKEIGFIHWISPNTGATNETGFTAYGAGVKDMWNHPPDLFWGLNERAIFFTVGNHYYGLDYNTARLIRGYWSYPGKNEDAGKNDDFYASGSVRCLKE